VLINLQGQRNKPLFTTDQAAQKLFSISLPEHECLLVFLFRCTFFLGIFNSTQKYCLQEGRAIMLLFITVTPDAYNISQPPI